MQINYRNQHKPYYHAVDYWESLGGTYTDNINDYIYGSDEILIDFMLTYTYAQYVNIKEIIQ